MTKAAEYRPIDEGRAAQRFRATPVDRHVGGRVKLRRLELGISADGLGQTIGVLRQQIEKYEGADNRITCGRLHEIAQALNVPAGWFFEELPGGIAATGTPRPTASPAVMEVVKLWDQLRPDQRSIVRAMATSLIEANARADQERPEE